MKKNKKQTPQLGEGLLLQIGRGSNDVNIQK